MLWASPLPIFSLATALALRLNLVERDEPAPVPVSLATSYSVNDWVYSFSKAFINWGLVNKLPGLHNLFVAANITGLAALRARFWSRLFSISKSSSANNSFVCS